jgi:sugar lactone lactonase YvrE
MIEVDKATGEPDGLTVDGDGGLWLAIWDGGRIDHFDSDGTPLGSVSVGTPRPTSCTLADMVDGTYLVITTASTQSPGGAMATSDPLAGAILRTRVDAKARPAATFEWNRAG